MRRSRSVMLRLNEDEYDALARAKPDGEDLASFARATLVEAVSGREPGGPMRRIASFIVACLSPEITFEEALVLFDQHMTPDGAGVADGLRD